MREKANKQIYQDEKAIIHNKKNDKKNKKKI